MLSRFQPNKNTPTTTPKAPNSQQLIPPTFFQKSMPPRDPAPSATNNFERFPAQDDSISPHRCSTPASTTSPPQTPPVAVIKPLSIEIPRTSPQLFKSKLQLTYYYKQLMSYNNLLKLKESYLNNLLFNSNPQALRILNSLNDPRMCSNNCISKFCKNPFCINKLFPKTPKIITPDPAIITDPPHSKSPSMRSL